jgi:hypothetical protein
MRSSNPDISYPPVSIHFDLERFTMTLIAGFVRRENADSTTDSICIKCFRTIAKGPSGKVDLISAERNHECEPTDEQRRHPLGSDRLAFLALVR